MKRGHHPNSQKTQYPKLPTGHSTATVRVSGPKEAVEKFQKDETAESRGRIAEAHYRVPTDRFPPIPINPLKP